MNKLVQLNVSFCFVFIVSLIFIGSFDLPTRAQAKAPEGKIYKFVNGRWFDGKTFKRKVFYSANGILSIKRPQRIDETIDLKNGYVVPPFADSHCHHFDSRFNIDVQIRDYLRDGVFYAKVTNNFRSGAAQVKDKVNKPQSVDVSYAHGGLTGSFSHPAEVYEALRLGFYSYEQQTANAAKIWQSRKSENDAYYIIDDAADLNAKWANILTGKSDFIKVFLRHSEVYQSRRSFIPVEWNRPDGGVDPRLVPEIVKRAHEARLRVSVAVSSVPDYQVAIEAGADEITHLPCYQGVGDGEDCGIPKRDARLTAENGIYVSLITSAYEEKRGEKVIEFDRSNLKQLKVARVKFVLGSDSYGSTPVGGAVAMSKLGLFGNLELLKIWCENTPQTIFPNRRIGRLKDGYEASFLVLRGNPLEDFEQVKNIDFRFKQGFIVSVK